MGPPLVACTPCTRSHACRPSVPAHVPLPPPLAPRLPPLQYDASTTVMEAVEQLAGQIKLENYQTFSLFAVQKVREERERAGPAGRRIWGPAAQRAACLLLAAGCS